MARRRSSTRRPAATKPSYRTCDFYVTAGSKKRCPNPGVVFVMGDWRCRSHLPPEQPKCSHSLAPSGRCAFCGQEVPS